MLGAVVKLYKSGIERLDFTHTAPALSRLLPDVDPKKQQGWLEGLGLCSSHIGKLD